MMPKAEIPNPSIEVVGDGGRGRDPWLITQQLHELAADFSAVKTKTDRLIGDVSEISKDVKTLREMVQFVRGVLFGGGTLLIVFGGLFWWVIGGKIDTLRDYVLRMEPGEHQPATTEPRQLHKN